jgi:hypothetical protein
MWVLLLVPILYVNATVTHRLWRSRKLTASKKITRTLLIWLVPGSFLPISNRLRDSPPAVRPRRLDGVDPQVSDWLAAGGDHLPPDRP